MDGFYAYVVDKDGHVISRTDFFFESEEEAKKRARLLADGHDVELWQLDRRIATFKRLAEGQAAALTKPESPDRFTAKAPPRQPGSIGIAETKSRTENSDEEHTDHRNKS
jgi:hypothetical protein